MNEMIDILLIENSPHDAELIRKALRKENVFNKVLHVENGEDALEYICATGKYVNRNNLERPMLILLDMDLLNGLEILKKIKSDKRAKIIPVVVLTSSKEDNDIIESHKLDMISYIIKPLEFKTFAKVVSKAGLYWLLISKTPE